ncbi:4Fe-4S single cluster domain-containing protein [Nocardia sp. NPDC058705]|uniref:4Fe-4S single cluster domain-containing protein n=1 Tax=Nocardia sp. NPDC058705 TaxID=3346609 RepID=UPI0036839689
MDVPVLNIAATSTATESLGPGFRAVVWVQGCPLNCRGCVAPEWIPIQPRRLVPPAELAADLLAGPAFDGLTLSGGEPMLQAQALAELVRRIRAENEITVICFTGFTLARLRATPPGPGVAELLSQIDILVDGPYVAARDDGRGLRGSTNQVVHHLTDRLRDCGYDFEHRVRTAELHVDERSVTLVGIPPHGLLATLDSVLADGPVVRGDS